MKLAHDHQVIADSTTSCFSDRCTGAEREHEGPVDGTGMESDGDEVLGMLRRELQVMRVIPQLTFTRIATQ